MPEGKTIDTLKVGDSAQITNRITERRSMISVRQQVILIPSISTRLMPRNLFQRKGRPRCPLGRVHLPSVLGNLLPGPGSIYLSQEVKFLAPVRIGDTITATVEVIELVPEKNRGKFRTTCVNQDGKEAADGTAWAMPPKKD